MAVGRGNKTHHKIADKKNKRLRCVIRAACCHAAAKDLRAWGGTSRPRQDAAAMPAVLDLPVGSWPPAPSSFPDSPLSRALRQPLLLGLFLPIQAGGWSASRL